MRRRGGGRRQRQDPDDFQRRGRLAGNFAAVVWIADVGTVHGEWRGVGWRGRSRGARPPPLPARRPARLLLRSRLTRRRPSQFPTFTAHYWHTSNYGESWHLHEMEGACKPALPFRPLLSRLREAAVQTHLTSASHRVKRRWDSRPSSPQAFRGLRATRTEVGKLGSELCSNIHTWYINATCARTNGQAL